MVRWLAPKNRLTLQLALSDRETNIILVNFIIKLIGSKQEKDKHNK